jgi:hypothetical protein
MERDPSLARIPFWTKEKRKVRETETGDEDRM